MTRESIDAKASRYLTEGRLIIDHLVDDRIRASVRGAGEIHRCGHDLARGWWCSCHRTNHQHCAHLAALQQVTARRQEPTR